MSKPVLVVEDESQVRSVIKLMLSEAGFDVIEAAEGTAAIHEIWKRRGEISIIITDIDMGHMSGLELAESVKARFPAVPILFISALPVVPSELEQVAPGSVLLKKPFDTATLVEAIRKLIDRV